MICLMYIHQYSCKTEPALRSTIYFPITNHKTSFFTRKRENIIAFNELSSPSDPNQVDVHLLVFLSGFERECNSLAFHAASTK